MSQLPTLIHNGALGVTVGGLLYAVSTMTPRSSRPAQAAPAGRR